MAYDSKRNQQDNNLLDSHLHDSWYKRNHLFQVFHILNGFGEQFFGNRVGDFVQIRFWKGVQDQFFAVFEAYVG